VKNGDIANATAPLMIIMGFGWSNDSRVESANEFAYVSGRLQ
jgi:hypothetical protein